MDKLTQDKLYLARLQREYSKKLWLAYDASDIESRPTPHQQEFLNDLATVPVRWVVAGNRSGKTGGAAREAAWVFMRNHPTVDINALWGDTPLTMIILGQKSSHLEDEIWRKKIKPLLPAGSYKEVRSGNVLQKVEGIGEGCKDNIIIFQSHNNPNEARENIQAFTAHWVWIDEMPGSASLVSELIMRIVTTKGRFIATFTPLAVNLKIRKMVDMAALPIGKRYVFSIMDNPAIEDLAMVLEQIRQSCSSEAEYRTRVFGDWATPGLKVSAYDPDEHKRKTPPTYDRVWRHLASIDPSASGLTGLTLWTEDPTDGRWYNIKAMYINGKAAFELVDEIEKEIAGCNLYVRVCDPNPAGYYQELSRRKIDYKVVNDKAYNKQTLIDKSNEAFLNKQIFLTEASELLEEELIAAAWDEKIEGKIVNGSRYHLFDSLQYMVYAIPKWEPYLVTEWKSFEHSLYQRNEKQKKEKAKIAARNLYKIQVKQRAKHRRRRHVI